MATVTVTAPYNTNLSQNFTVENNSNPLLDASFSSYLAGGEKTSVLNLGESTRSPSSSSSMERKIIKDCEISIFSAEKYFNGGMDEKETEIYEDCTNQLQVKEAKFDQQSPKTTNKSKNQSTNCSEASWNSKSALVPALLKDPSRRNEQKPASGWRIFRGFGCNCCFGKKSVDIEEQVKKNVDLHESPETKEPVEIGENPSILAGNKQIRPELRFKEELGGKEIDEVGVKSNREVDCFTFPILNPQMENLTVDKQLEREKKVPHSLEVFGSPFSGNEDMGPNLENRLKSLDLDSGTKIRDTPASFRDSRTDFDDLGSDTSSDLFEIEGLSSNLPFFRQSESDGTLGFPTCATFYEPSEESIDWSIVTASAANFSVASDSEDQKSTIKMMDPVELILTTTTTTTTTATTMTKKVKTPMVKAVRRSRSNSIMNCRDDKAVQVASNQCKLPEKLKSDRRRRLWSDTMMPLVRFQSDGQLGIRSLSRSRSAHMSGSLYLH